MKLAGPAHPRPADRSAPGRLRRPAAVPVLTLQPAPLRLRARPPGDADPVRHLPGGEHLHAWDSALPEQTRPSSSPSNRVPAGQPARADRCPSRPDSSPASRTRPPASTRRSRSRSRRTDGDQNLSGVTSRPRPGSRRRCAGFPTARRRRSPTSPRRGYTGLAELACAVLSGRQPGRHLGRRGAAPAPGPSHVSGRVYLAGPYKGRAAQPRRRHPGRLRALRPRQRRRQGPRSRRPGRTRRSPRSPTRSRRSSRGCRCGCARC